MTDGGLENAFGRDDGDAYEAARRGAVWNARTPDRFPDLVVQAHSEDDLLAAVRRAKREGF
jgi:hypothetical protein